MKQAKPKQFVVDTINIPVDKEGWKLLKKQKPPEGIMVDVRFSNGKIIEGKMEKTFLKFDPSKMDAETMISKPTEWKLK